MLRIIIVFILGMSLGGCFIAPGMRMPSPSGSADNNIKINFIPISVALVRSMGHYPQSQFRHNHSTVYHYDIGPYDILNINIWGHSEFNQALGQAPSEQGANASLNPTMAPVGYLVGPDGDIFFPLVGYLHVGGNTVEQVRRDLTRALSKYIRHPQVDVRVTGFRSRKVYVMGEVHRPGLQPLTDSPMSITDAINLAGGLIPDSAEPGHIFVIRGNYARPDVYWLDASSPTAMLLGEHFPLHPQDVIFVSTAGVSRWNRAISQILPTIQTFWFTKTLVKN